MDLNTFKKKLRNLEPGRELVYHQGELACARDKHEEVNIIGALALAVDELGFGAVFQRRRPRPERGFDYVLRVFKRLGLRRDGNGGYQEVLRVANLHIGRIREVA